MQDISGRAIPETGQSVGILKVGKIWGVLGTAADPQYDKAVYLITSGEETGRFTTVEDESTKVLLPAKFIDVKDNGIAPIRI